MRGQWLLLLDAGAFSVASGLVGWQLHSSRRARALENIPSAGQTLRVRFLWLLLASCLARVTSLVVEYTLRDATSGLFGWAMDIVHSVPDLLFVTAYATLIFVMARLHAMARGVGSYAAWQALRVFLVLMFLSFAAACMATALTGRYTALRTACFLFFGAWYALAFLGMLYYGMRAMAVLTPREEEAAPASASGLRTVLRRVMCLVMLCCTVFVLRSVYCFMAASGLLHATDGYPGSAAGPVVNRYVFDSVTYAYVELLPVGVMAAMLRGMAAGGGGGGGDGDGGGGGGQSLSGRGGTGPGLGAGSTRPSDALLGDKSAEAPLGPGAVAGPRVGATAPAPAGKGTMARSVMGHGSALVRPWAAGRGVQRDISQDTMLVAACEAQEDLEHSGEQGRNGGAGRDGGLGREPCRGQDAPWYGAGAGRARAGDPVGGARGRSAAGPRPIV